MAYLPQHPSEEVATKDDVARLEARFDRLEDIVRDQQKFYVGTVVGSMTALTAIFSLVVGLILEELPLQTRLTHAPWSRRLKLSAHMRSLTLE